MMKTSLTIFPCVLGSAFLYIRVCLGLSFATKSIGPPCCTLFTFVTCCSLQIILSQNYLLPTISVLAENTLLKTACHFLLLLVGFDTFTYWKELQLIPYTCGSSRLFYGAVSGEWSAFGKWNLVRRHLYSVLKFIFTCYYGKQSFEGFVRGIFTPSGTTISYPSTYYMYWIYLIWNSFGNDRTTAS